MLAASLADLAAARARLGSPVVLVPTMGALHDGHRSLLRHAAGLAGPDGSVVVSIFVNPRQFGPNEDLDRYPRTLGADLDLCAGEGVAVVFAPAAAEMYPAEPVVTVDPGPMGQLLEGEFRPGFFGGVLTVVLKLFGLVRPDIAVFGEKDAQQLALVRRMSEDLDLGIQIAPVPTFRDNDGLATSSRTATWRRTMPRGEGHSRRSGGWPGGSRRRAAGGRRSRPQEPGPGGRRLPDGGAAAPGAAAPHVPLAVDYLALVDPRTFQPVPPGFTGTAILAVAARVGGTRPSTTSRSSSADAGTGQDRRERGTMLLAIDVGNTNTVLGVFDGEEVIEHWRIATVPDRTADEIAVVLSGLLAQSAVFKDTAPGRAQAGSRVSRSAQRCRPCCTRCGRCADATTAKCRRSSSSLASRPVSRFAWTTPRRWAATAS